MQDESKVVQKKRLLFVFNPLSGTGQIKGKLFPIIDLFTKAGYEVTAYPTQGKADAYKKVFDDGKEYDRIVCSGGDGTLDETVSAVMDAGLQLPLGYIPAGSTNDFATSLHIPKNMEQAAEIAVQGTPFLCDVGSANGTTFVYVAAFGAFTDVSYETTQEMKNLFGHAAYIMEGVKRIGRFPSYKTRVCSDSKVIEGEFVLGLISNSRSVGGFTMITEKDTELDDGLFEVLLIRKPKSAMEWNEIGNCLLNHRPDEKNVYIFKTKEIQFEFEKEPPWTIDGEFGGKHKCVTIKNIHQAITIMVRKQM